MMAAKDEIVSQHNFMASLIIPGSGIGEREVIRVSE